MAAPLRIAVSSTCRNLALLASRTSCLQSSRGMEKEAFKPIMSSPSFGQFQGDGCYVLKGDTLVKQRTLKDYPGENVGIDNKNTLYALCEGTVVISGEKINPYPDSPLYEKVQSGVQIYRRFFHVVPVKTHAKFKLVSMT